MANITPETAILHALRHQSLSYKAILGELIDNAFDAGANTISIDVIGKDLIVTDDGHGCPDLTSMVTLGKHIKQSGTKLGRYGVGLKDAALWLGGPTRIKSVNHGVSRSVYVDWDHLNNWEIPDPSEIEADHGDRGTKIAFINVCHRFPDGARFDDLVSDLGYLFTPAIKSGKQITFRGKNKRVTTASRFELPRLEDVVDCDVIVEGKRAHVHVGIVPDGDPNPRPGIAYTHGFRVIIGETALGCGGRSSARISGWVSLDGGWRLNKNKDGVNVDTDALGDAVYGAIKHIVDKSAKQAMSLRSAELSQTLTQMLRGMASDPVDARRDQSGDKPGSIAPKSTGRTHKNANKSRDGSSRRSVSIGRMSVEFRECRAPRIGEVDLHAGVIYLAENNSWISFLRKNERLEGLVTAAFSLFAAEDSNHQPSLPAKWAAKTSSMTFSEKLGLLLKDMSEPAIKAVA